jgi:hypothetical protein
MICRKCPATVVPRRGRLAFATTLRLFGAKGEETHFRVFYSSHCAIVLTIA